MATRTCPGGGIYKLPMYGRGVPHCSLAGEGGHRLE